MALMKFREANHVQWNGARPAHDGTQIVVFKSVTNADGRIYTTPADVTFFLCAVTINISPIAAGTVYCRIYDDGGVVTYYVMERIVLAAEMPSTKHFTFWPPMELLTDWSVRVGSNAAGLQLIGSVFGWIE